MRGSNSIAASAVAAFALLVSGIGIAAEGDPKEKEPPVPASDAPGKVLARFGVEQGFRAGVVAEPSLANPSAMTVDSQGRFLIIEQVEGKARLQRIEAGQPSKASTLAEWPSPSESGMLVQGDKIWISDGVRIWMQNGVESGALTGREEVLSVNMPAEKVKDRHGLRAPVLGPDGRLYASVADFGAVVKTKEGGTLSFSEDGGVIRCEPDGSHAEIFCRGLRDPHGLAFDYYGNLFAVDSAAGFGDRDRWEYLVQGGDYGWRRGWEQQPLGRDRNPWLTEKLWQPAFEGQAAWMLPPVANVPEGTAGPAFYPGTGFIPRYDGHFFFGSFVDSPLRCALNALSLTASGASFQPFDMQTCVAHCAASHSVFGSDGKLCFTAGQGGRSGESVSRIFELSDPQSALAADVAQTRRLLTGGIAAMVPVQLAALLGHKDQRVRLAAEWALAELPQGATLLAECTRRRGEGETRLARLHAIWGLGIRARRAESAQEGSGSQFLAPLLDLLDDSDEEVCAQAVKTLGESRWPAAYDGIARALRFSAPRVSYFAAEALGKFGRSDCIPQILLMARETRGQHPFLRHVYARALADLHNVADLERGITSGDPSVRLVVLLALRKMEHAQIAAFLNDEEPDLVLEAARAINDVPIEDALPALAAMIEKPEREAALMLRALNANFQIGKPVNAKALAEFASRDSEPAALRVEALELLGVWARPPERDRITGLRLQLPERGVEAAVSALQDLMPGLLQTSDPEVALAAIKTGAALSMKQSAPELQELLVKSRGSVEVRCQAIEILAAWEDPKLEDAISLAESDSNFALRIAAARAMPKRSQDRAAGILVDVLSRGSVAEMKAALLALRDIRSPTSGLRDPQSPIADEALKRCLEGTQRIPAEAEAELFDAASVHLEPTVRASLSAWTMRLRHGDLPLDFYFTLSGGDAKRGRAVFFDNADAGCIRCHRIHDEGGENGPDLTNVGASLDRRAILESIIAPNGPVAMRRRPLFITAKNGDVIAGYVESEDDSEIVLRTPGSLAVRWKKAEIASREIVPAGMPGDFGLRLSYEQIRDLVEYLASLK